MCCRSSSAREMVLLPTPDGPQRTINSPCCLLATWFIRRSFDVLHLFFEPIDRPLDLHDVSGDRRVVRLAGDRVRLAEHLLGDEVQLPARVLVGAAGVLEGLEV